MTGAPAIFDRDLLRQRRNRHAGTAAAHDFLLTRVAEDFADRLSIVRRDFPFAVNIGAYHGAVSRYLRNNARIGTMADSESAPGLLAQCDGPRILTDDEALPFAEASLDLAVSALSLQLVNDVPGVLAQMRRALKPDGLLLAAVLGGETLKELREAWLAAESEVTGGASPRIAPFADVREFGALLQRAGFALPVADSDVVRVTYETPFALMRELQRMGASNMLVERRRVPVTRRLLMRAGEIYSERFALPDGRIPATFEIITLTAWVPHESQQKPLKPGTAKMRLSEALGVTEQAAGEVAGASPKDRATKE
ncbi:MAG: methyltransferase domain-containing protein [Hyphomicrobium sp.]